jgi:predicted transcriptional regulator
MPSGSLLSVPSATSRRIEKLAAEAGRTPAQMLRFVLRDGLEYTEHAVREANAGLDDLANGRSVTLDEAKRHLAAQALRRAKAK